MNCVYSVFNWFYSWIVPVDPLIAIRSDFEAINKQIDALKKIKETQFSWLRESRDDLSKIQNKFANYNIDQVIQDTRKELIELSELMNQMGQEAIQELRLEDPEAAHKLVPKQWIQEAVKAQLALQSYERQVKLINLGMSATPVSPFRRIQMVRLIRDFEKNPNKQPIEAELKEIERELQHRKLSRAQRTDLHSIKERLLALLSGAANRGVSSSIYPPLKDYSVVSQGDILSMRGKWVITRREKVGGVTTYEESAKSVFDVNIERGEKQRSRIVVKNGGITRENRDEHFSVRSAGWTENKEFTAAVDYREAVLTYRHLAKLILDGESVDLNLFLRLSSYFDAISKNDLASYENSYAREPAFIEALGDFGSIKQLLVGAIEERAKIAVLENIEKNELEDPDYHIGLKRLIEAANLFINWSKNIEAFLKAANESKKFETACRWYVDEVRKVAPHVKEITSLFPKNLNELDIDPKILRQKISSADAIAVSAIILDVFNNSKMKSVVLAAADLQAAEADPKKSAKRQELFSKFTHFLPISNTAVTCAFQINTRRNDCLDGFFKVVGKADEKLTDLGRSARIASAMLTIESEILRANLR